MPRFERTTRCLCAGVLWAWLTILAAASVAVEPTYVIDISVDGLGSSYLNALINTNQLPNFRRLQAEGAWTHNARNDYDDTTTLANHTTILTGRGLAGPDGHNWSYDGTPGVDETIHSNKGSYVASVFDVAHDNGLSTALFGGKSKFILFDQSYNGARVPDVTGPVDNGTRKIDSYVYAKYAAQIDAYVTAMTASPFQYSFLHLRDPDTAGHGPTESIPSEGWGNTDYNNAVKAVDGYLGRVLRLVNTDPVLRGRTAIILTADHGGRGTGHSTITEPLDYTIPFYAWGVGVAAGADLYALNPTTRANPAGTRPSTPTRLSRCATATSPTCRWGSWAWRRSPVRRSMPLRTLPSRGLRRRNRYCSRATTSSSSRSIRTSSLPSAGDHDWTPGVGQVELGFSTPLSTPQLGTSPIAAVYDTSNVALSLPDAERACGNGVLARRSCPLSRCDRQDQRHGQEHHLRGR